MKPTLLRPVAGQHCCGDPYGTSMWRWAAAVLVLSLALAVPALAGSAAGAGGLLLNAGLLACVAAVPVAMHSNNAFKGRRAKHARP